MAHTTRDDLTPSATGRAAVPRPRDDTGGAWRPVAFIAAFLVVALVAPVLVLQHTSERTAAARAAEYHAALLALRIDLGTTQQAMAVLTEPTAEPSKFRELLPVIGDLEADIAAARETAAKRMPFAWPFAPPTWFDELGPIRQRLAEDATTAESIVEDLVVVLDYRAVIGDVLVADPLPLVPPRNFKRFTARVTETAGVQASLLDDLPDHEALTNHKADVRAGVRRYEDWVVEYVNALWIGDTPTVNTLLSELTSLRGQLDRLLRQSLSAIRTDLDGEILRLAEALEEDISALEG